MTREQMVRLEVEAGGLVYPVEAPSKDRYKNLRVCVCVGTHLCVCVFTPLSGLAAHHAVTHSGQKATVKITKIHSITPQPTCLKGREMTPCLHRVTYGM